MITHDVGTDGEVWREAKELLDRRMHPKWESLSWVTLRPLISALNDRLNGLAPHLVRDSRLAWRAAQDRDRPWPPTADGYELVVDRTAESAFILLGDTGEQDASQYVVVPALRRAAHEVDFMVICSDVIYPSGDINDYDHGLFLPYGPWPEHERDTDALARLPILALPGNHDWYDGLTGFMWAFCGADPLPATTYGWPAGDGVLEGVTRMLWRRPSRPYHPGALAAQRRARAREGEWTPLQPGSYYAVETAHLLLVCVDTGIGRMGESSIDVPQAEWLARISARPGKPKVLLTGNPLLVNRQWYDCTLGALGSGGTATVTGADGTELGSVRQIVEHPAHGYVAAIGGDIHNFQHYRVSAPGHPRGELHHIVSGGGGAYLSATHTLPDAFEVQQRVAGGAAAPAVPAARPLPEGVIPEPAHSLGHFGRLVLPGLWRFMRLLLAVQVGIAAAAATVAVGDPSDLRVLLLLAAAGFAAGILARIAMQAKATQTPAYRAAAVVVALLAGLLVGLALWWLAPDRYAANLGGWVGLTATGALIAWLLRRTGWWQSPVPGAPESLTRPLTVLVCALAAAIGFVAYRRDAWLAAALTLVVVTAAAGWRRRRLDPRWDAHAPRLAYVVQILGALVVLGRLVMPPGSRWLPAGAVLGVLGAGLLGLACVALVAGGVLVAAVARAAFARGQTPGGWRDAWGQVGRFGSLIVGGCVLVVLGLLFWAARTVPGHGLRRAVLVGMATPALTVIGIFVVDLVRRHVEGPRYKAVAGLIGLAAFTAVAAGAQGSWIPRAAATGGVSVALAVLTVVIVHLTFLGAYSLVRDLEAHTASMQFSVGDAESVLAWRAGGPPPQESLVRQRANIVFPAANRPRGPIQRKVSEVFDSDRAPFWKNFLVVTSTPDWLTVEVNVVTGADDPPVLDPIRIPLR